MLVVMQHDATAKDVDRVISIIQEMGYEARPMPGAQRTAVGLVGNDGRVDASRLEALPGVAQIIHVSQPYKQVSREWRGGDNPLRLGFRAPRARRRRGGPGGRPPPRTREPRPSPAPAAERRRGDARQWRRSR